MSRTPPLCPPVTVEASGLRLQTVQLPGRWRIVLEGDQREYLLCAHDRKGLGWALGRLFDGKEVNFATLNKWGFHLVSIEDRDAE